MPRHLLDGLDDAVRALINPALVMHLMMSWLVFVPPMNGSFTYDTAATVSSSAARDVAVVEGARALA